MIFSLDELFIFILIGFRLWIGLCIHDYLVSVCFGILIYIFIFLFELLFVLVHTHTHIATIIYRQLTTAVIIRVSIVKF